jgi:simple sugar transport system ATP-binding protein
VLKVILLETRDLRKNFGSVQALTGVNLSLGRGEIVGLVGDNAAGKSTLLKLIFGIYTPDHGEILVEEHKANFKSPLEARNWGIEMIFQDFMLCPELDVASNVFLGREITELKVLLAKKRMEQMVKQATEREKWLDLNVKKRVTELSGGQQQFTSILRALMANPKLILLDEPTASLSPKASATLVGRLRATREKDNVSMVYVSHKLPEVISVSDRIVVLRRGQVAAEIKSEEATPENLIKQMIGG